MGGNPKSLILTCPYPQLKKLAKNYLDKKIPHLHLFEPVENAEGPKTDLKKTELLVLAIALHNIPEGLAVGVAFGALAHGMDIGIEIGGAIALAIGMDFASPSVTSVADNTPAGIFSPSA